MMPADSICGLPEENPWDSHNVRRAATMLFEIGWSLFPIPGGKKKAACKWKRLQSIRMSKTALLRNLRSDSNLAVVLGNVSDGLMCRDFDSMASYDEWKANHPDLAELLPTVATGCSGGGRHVYFNGDPSDVRDASPTGSTIIDYGDGELRAGGYNVLPPSRHPKGANYFWLKPPTDVPFVSDLVVAGLMQSPRLNENGQCSSNGTQDSAGQPKDISTDETWVTQESSQTLHGEQAVLPPCLCESDLDAINCAILQTLPTGPGQRHRLLFQFARHLQAIPSLRTVEPVRLEPIVRRWWELALPKIQTKSWIESWSDFLEGWDKVRFAKGEGAMSQVVARARKRVHPIRSIDDKYKLLIEVCRELQLVAGENPFFLDCRTAAGSVGVAPITVSRWLQHLVRVGTLRQVSVGKRGRASEFFFVGK